MGVAAELIALLERASAVLPLPRVRALHEDEDEEKHRNDGGDNQLRPECPAAFGTVVRSQTRADQPGSRVWQPDEQPKDDQDQHARVDEYGAPGYQGQHNQPACAVVFPGELPV